MSDELPGNIDDRINNMFSYRDAFRGTIHETTDGFLHKEISKLGRDSSLYLTSVDVSPDKEDDIPRIKKQAFKK